MLTYIFALLILSMMGAISALLGRKNGRGILWNFVAGAFFGPFAWVSVPYLRPRPKRHTDPRRDLAADERVDDMTSGEDDEEPGWNHEDSSDQRKIIRNCILLFLGMWLVIAVIERLT